MQLEINGLFKKKVSIEFTQENTSSDGGLLLVKNILDQFHLTKRMADLFRETRDLRYVDHSLESLLSQRLYQLMAGYEDVNDSNSLRHDPVFKLLVKNQGPEADALASASTLCRVENQAGISEIHALTEMQVDLYLERNRKRWRKAAKKKKLVIRLDLDPTDLETYGHQQQALFHGYYGHTCYLPMIIADGDNGDLTCAFLRPGTKHAKFLLVPVLKRLFAKIEAVYPGVRFELRADSGFQCPEIFEFLESKSNVLYTIALATNPTLERPLREQISALEKERQEAEEKKQSFESRKIFGEIGYRAESWKSFRRVVYQIDANKNRVELRLMTTNDRRKSAQLIKENYNQRANIENRIKELKTQAFGSRMSCETFRANSLRFALTCFSMIVYQELKKKLKGTALENNYVQSLREKLFKVAVQIQESARRFILRLPKSYPYQDVWEALLSPA